MCETKAHQRPSVIRWYKIQNLPHEIVSFFNECIYTNVSCLLQCAKKSLHRGTITVVGEGLLLL